MAWDKDVLTVGKRVSTDLSTYQYGIVYLSGAETAALVTSSAQLPFGSIYNKPESGETAEVAYAGIVKCKAIGSTSAINIGDPLRADSHLLTLATTEGSPIFGFAMEACSASGVVIPVLVSRGAMVSAWTSV